MAAAFTELVFGLKFYYSLNFLSHNVFPSHTLEAQVVLKINRTYLNTCSSTRYTCRFTERICSALPLSEFLPLSLPSLVFPAYFLSVYNQAIFCFHCSTSAFEMAVFTGTHTVLQLRRWTSSITYHYVISGKYFDDICFIRL